MYLISYLRGSCRVPASLALTASLHDLSQQARSQWSSQAGPPARFSGAPWVTVGLERGEEILAHGTQTERAWALLVHRSILRGQPELPPGAHLLLTPSSLSPLLSASLSPLLSASLLTSILQYMFQINMLYTLNLYNAICQIYFN